MFGVAHDRKPIAAVAVIFTETSESKVEIAFIVVVIAAGTENDASC